MSITIPTKREKCIGAMLATAIGDALGWPNEPRSKNRVKKPKVHDFFVEWTRSCKQPRWHDEKIFAGEYSDDTQLTLSVARSIIMGEWETFFAEKELPFWLKYERGGGRALLKAARSIAEGKVLPWQSTSPQDYLNAGGNGAAMRILPHVIAYANKPDKTALISDIIRNTIITHGHPRAILGATCYAYALDFILRKENVLEYGELVSAVIDGKEYWGMFPSSEFFKDWFGKVNQYSTFDYAQEWDSNYNHMIRQLEFISTSLKKGLMLEDAKVMDSLGGYSSVNGAGDVTVLTAIYFASRYATNPVLGIKVPAFSFGIDTDTIASITGGLLGMLCGINWIPPEWKMVQDYNCLVQIVEILLSENKKETTKTEVSVVKSKSDHWSISPIGMMRLLETRQARNGNHGIVAIKKWMTALGQTIYMKEFQPFEAEPHNRQDDSQTGLVLYQQSSMTEPPPKIAEDQQPASGDNAHKQTGARNSEEKFILDIGGIKTLLDNPTFNKAITMGKVLKIIRELIESDKSLVEIAKQFKVNEEMVALIKKYIK